MLIGLGLLSAGVDQGNYRATRVLFPYTMLSVAFNGKITLVFQVLALLQWPIYGALLSITLKYSKWLCTICLVSLIAIHVVSVCLAFKYVHW